MQVVLICVLIIVACVLVLLFAGKISANFEKDFYKSPNLQNERDLLSKLKDIESFYPINKNSSTSSEEAYDENHKMLTDFIKAGALVVIASGTTTQSVSTAGVDVITPEVVFQRNFNLGTRVISTASVKTSDIVFVKGLAEKITQKKQASVVGQAVAGSVIAGGAGAVVGAINAASNNASGGKEVTVGLRNYYYLNLMYSGEMIDTIYINTSVIDRFGAPPKEFVVKKDTDYWRIEATPKNQMLGGLDRSVYDDYVAYITKVLNYYGAKTTLKSKGQFAVLNISKEARIMQKSDSEKAEQSQVKATHDTATPKAKKKVFAIPALIINVLVSLGMVFGEITTIKDFVANPSAQLGTAMVLLGLATIVSLPGFGKVIFRKKYGVAQRILRWVIFAAIIALDIAIMTVVF